MLFFITIVPMLGVEALRAGAGLAVTGRPSEDVALWKEELFVSGVKIS